MNSDERIGRAACRVALAVAVTASILGLPGCGKSNSSSSGSAGQTTTITSPTGTVSGTVEDDDGNPIAGASVYVAGQTPVTTNAGGQFSVGVTVTGANTSGTQSSATATNAPTGVSIQIVPPAGYLAASLMVTPAAQITTSDIGASATGETNPQEVFIDGFSASAGIVKIPALLTTVTGTIVNSATGNPVPTGTKVDLDFIGANFDQLATGTGVAVTYGAQFLTVTTSATGSFTFTSVADNSCYRIDAPGFALNPTASNFIDSCNTLNSAALGGMATNTGNFPLSTDPNGFGFSTIVQSPNSVILSRITAAPAITGSTSSVQPYVTNVANVINEAANDGQLDSAVTNTLVITFSEPVTYTPSTTFPVEVIVGTGLNLTAAAISSISPASGSTSTLTITLASNLPANSNVDVDLPVQSFVDANGNFLTAGIDVALLSVPSGCTGRTSKAPSGGTAPPLPPESAACGSIPTAVGFDNLMTKGAANTNEVDELALGTIGTVTTTAPAATLVQVTAEAPTASAVDTAAFKTTSALVTTVDYTNPVLMTVTSQNTNVSTDSTDLLVQLNSQVGNTTVPYMNPPSDSAANLTALLDALEGSTEKVYTDFARVKVTIPAGTNDVALSSLRAGIPQDVLFFPINDGAGVPTVTVLTQGTSPVGSTSSAPLGNGELWYDFTPPAGATFPYSFDVMIVGDDKSNIYSGVLYGTATGLTTGLVLPGDTLAAVSRTSGGLVGSMASLVLNDLVPPTTGIQLLQEAIAAAGSNTSGAGGGVISTAGAIGTVVYPISPQAGDVSYSTGPYSGDTFQDDFEVNNPKYAGADTTYLSQIFSAGGLINQPSYGGIGGTSVLADATTTLNYLNTTVTGNKNYVLGVSVTEPVSLAAGAPAYSGSATLTGFAAGGSLNQASQKDPSLAKVNLVTFVPSSLLALQADGRSDATLSFTGAIQDTAATPNVATAAANAVVQLRDFFPPLMVAGFFDGTNFVFDFDEPVSLKGNLAFFSPTMGTTCTGIAGNGLISLTYSMTGVSPITLGAGTFGANTRITVPYSNFLAQNTGVHVLDCFSLPPYFEAEYNTNPALGAVGPTVETAAESLPSSAIAATPVHGGVIYVDVPDTANNTDLVGPGNFSGANTWHGGITKLPVKGSWDKTGLGLTSPVFAVADLLGPFQVVASDNPGQCFNFTTGSAHFDCVFEFTQPIFFGNPNGGANDADGDNAFGGAATASAGPTGTFTSDWCVNKFGLYNASNKMQTNPGDEPDYCVPVTSAGATITGSGTGGAYTQQDLVNAYGVHVYFGYTTPAVADTPASTSWYVNLADRTALAVPGGLYISKQSGDKTSSISSLFYIGSYSVNNYGTGGDNIPSTATSLQTSGVIVEFNGLTPNGPVELSPSNP